MGDAVIDERQLREEAARLVYDGQPLVPGSFAGQWVETGRCAPDVKGEILRTLTSVHARLSADAKRIEALEAEVARVTGERDDLAHFIGQVSVMCTLRPGEEMPSMASDPRAASGAVSAVLRERDAARAELDERRAAERAAKVKT